MSLSSKFFVIGSGREVDAKFDEKTAFQLPTSIEDNLIPLFHLTPPAAYFTRKLEAPTNPMRNWYGTVC